ncbi:ECF transporter S component [Limosilactobacillus fermentum]|jgi:uncharacterized membrane protein|uniref:ECF transporter S component n=1 Tax=Limosilactobacillus fermentum TaxID=1613 RepID=A0A1L7GWQ5_LIMFE|nr:ECF transporter S component [Limosilactobacillus fermentum]APU46368.1 ECF transporter S component [Limosilactobacillus fermentum]MDQ2153470.1 ECF transporter S component [Limosilactobacillus fermentum]
MQNRQQIQRLTTQALLIVIIVLQDLIPMIGNLPLGPLSITTLPITVGVVAVVWGPREGMVVGGVWGLLTWVRAFVYPSSPLAPLIFTNPLISFVPRLLIGLVAGWVFIGLKKVVSPSLAACFAGLIGSVTNTVLVLGGIYLFANTPAVASAYHATTSNLATALLAVVTTNGLVEMLVTALVVPAIALPVVHALKKDQ